MRMNVSFSLPVRKCRFYQSPYANSCFYQFFCLSVNAHVCTKASINAPFVVSRGPYILLNIHLHLTMYLCSHESAQTHTSKCIHHFAGIYAYCRHFIELMWYVFSSLSGLILYRKTSCHMPKDYRLH